MSRKFLPGLLLSVLLSSSLLAQEKIPFGDGDIHVIPLSESAVRIRYEEGQEFNLPNLIYTDSKPIKHKSSYNSDGTVTIRTVGYTLTVNPADRSVRISDRSGRVVFCADSHDLVKGRLYDQDISRASLGVKTDEGEFMYGLGQFQDGYTNVCGLSRRLTQVNTQISLPMYISSKGYGLLWNNYGLTDFNPSERTISLSRVEDSESKGEMVDVTSTTGGRREFRTGSTFTAELDVPQSGRWSLLLDCGRTMARRHNLVIDGKTVFDQRNLWLPPTCSAIVYLEAGKHTVSAEMEKDDTPSLGLCLVDDTTVLSSPVADAVDYTVFLGNADEITASYRALTGAIPMMPQWALGYIHCRERYHSSEEIIRSAETFREKQIPLDLIVQDWQWWGDNGWNSMVFDKKNYPSPRALTDSLHDMNVRLMLSVWSKIDKSSILGRQMLEKGYYIPDTDWIDFFNPAAAQEYWDNFSDKLLKPYRIDAWWQDATEPENDDLVGRMVAGGTLHGELVRNCYPLLVSKTVYEGFRKDDPERRSMILTRSAFPGMQRYGAATWSGDVGNDWNTLRTQISAGLGMMSAGQAWWTYDAGGFFRPRNQYSDQEYIERMTRWIQTSVFLPLMRVHGYMSDTEPWRYGSEAEQRFKAAIQMRYKLMPYIYSWASKISFEGSTLMRPLVFDFPNDRKALEQQTEYMFGDAFLVCPVTEGNIHIMECYLPENENGWYDLRDGEHYCGGRFIRTAVDMDAIPVFVRAGSIVPMGEDVQYAAQSIGGTLDIHVYPGANGSFTLYEDTGTDYSYENGEYSTIELKWNDSRKVLEIGARNGSYTGMPAQRSIRVTVGDSSKEISYNGHRVKVRF